MKRTVDQMTVSFKCNNNARKGEHQNLENKHKQIHWKSAHMPMCSEMNRTKNKSHY